MFQFHFTVQVLKREWSTNETRKILLQNIEECREEQGKQFLLNSYFVLVTELGIALLRGQLILTRPLAGSHYPWDRKGNRGLEGVSHFSKIWQPHG